MFTCACASLALRIYFIISETSETHPVSCKNVPMKSTKPRWWFLYFSISVDGTFWFTVSTQIHLSLDYFLPFSHKGFGKESRYIGAYNNEKMVVICILGIGRLGGNIAGDLAFNGHSVRVWDADKNALDKLHQRLDYERKRLKDDKLITLPKFLVSLRICKINSKVNLSKTHPFLRVMYFAFQIWRKHWQRRNLSLKLSMKIWETRNAFLKVSIEVCIHH